MATRTDPTHSQAISKFLFPLLGGRSLTWLGYIRVGAEGDSSAEDALTILNQKFDDGNFISSSANLPVADADQAALHYRTDENALYIKRRTGSPGSYSYEWIGPIDRGDYQLRLIYHTSTASTAPAYGITWNWQNETFNVTSGGWTLNEAGARWMRIVALPSNSNTASVSPGLRVGEITASDVSLTNPDGNGNLPTSISDVQELANWLDDDATFGSGGGGGGGGTGTDDQTAAEVPTTTTNFNQNLSSADRNVQLALDTIDNIDIPLLQVDEYGHSDTTYSDTVRFLETVGSFGFINIAVDQDLQTHRDTLGDTLYFESLLTFRVQRTTAGTLDTIRIRAELADRGTNTIAPRVVSVPSNTVSITESNTTTVDGSVRIAGPLPRTLNEARLQFVVEDNPSGSPAEAFVQTVRMEIKTEINSDEVIMNPDSLGNNIMTGTTLVNLNDFASQVDELPIQPGDYEDVDWPARIDIGGADSQKQRDIPIAQRIRDFNARAERQFIARISYRINYVAGTRTGAITDRVDYVHEIRSDADNYAAVITQWQTTQDATPTDVFFEVPIPAAATQLRVTYERQRNQANMRVDQQGARINVANYQLEYLEGIDSSGFTTAGRILNNTARSLQSLANLVYAHVPITTATGIAVDSNQFIDPNRGRGGLRDDLVPQGVTVTTPTNVQEAFNKADGIFRLLDNPFIANDMLTRSGGNHDFTVNSATAVRSEAVTIPQDLRDLGVDVTLRLKIRVNTISSTFDGNVSFVASTTPFTILDGTQTHRVRNQGASDTFDPGDFLIFQETVSAAQVPETFSVQFARDSSAGSANFHRGTAYMLDASGGASGGVGGGSGTGWEIIWQAGPGNSDRVTGVGSTVYTLANSAQFSDFTDFEAIYDTNATAGVAISEQISYDEIQRMLTAGLTGNQGTWIHIRYNYKLLKPLSQTTFSIPAGDTGIGFRRLRGRRA